MNKWISPFKVLSQMPKADHVSNYVHHMSFIFQEGTLPMVSYTVETIELVGVAVHRRAPPGAEPGAAR